MDDGALEGCEKGGRRLGRHRADHATCHQEPESMDRIAWVRHQDHVARRRDRLRDIGEAFFRAERGDDLRLRIELDAEPTRVIGGLRTPQTGNAARG